MHMHVAREGGRFTTGVHEYVWCTQGEIESRRPAFPANNGERKKCTEECDGLHLANQLFGISLNGK